MEDKKEYTAEEVAKGILEKAKELTKEALEKMEKADPMSQTSAQAAEIKMPQPPAPPAQPKMIAKQPLQLKKFMDKCMAKKMAKKE